MAVTALAGVQQFSGAALTQHLSGLEAKLPAVAVTLPPGARPPAGAVGRVAGGLGRGFGSRARLVWERDVITVLFVHALNQPMLEGAFTTTPNTLCTPGETKYEFYRHDCQRHQYRLELCIIYTE